MLDTAFTALADPTRRGLIEQLTSGPASVSALAAPHRMTMPAVLKHLTALEAGGLITRRKHGRVVTCALRPEGIRAAASYLERYRPFWTGALDRMTDLVEQEQP